MSSKVAVGSVKQATTEFEDWATGKMVHICVTEWGNGEGFDVDIEGTLFQLSHDQWKHLKKTIKQLYKD